MWHGVPSDAQQRMRRECDHNAAQHAIRMTQLSAWPSMTSTDTTRSVGRAATFGRQFDERRTAALRRRPLTPAARAQRLPSDPSHLSHICSTGKWRCHHHLEGNRSRSTQYSRSWHAGNRLKTTLPGPSNETIRVRRPRGSCDGIAARRSSLPGRVLRLRQNRGSIHLREVEDRVVPRPRRRTT